MSLPQLRMCDRVQNTMTLIKVFQAVLQLLLMSSQSCCEKQNYFTDAKIIVLGPRFNFLASHCPLKTSRAAQVIHARPQEEAHSWARNLPINLSG